MFRQEIYASGQFFFSNEYCPPTGGSVASRQSRCSKVNFDLTGAKSRELPASGERILTRSGGLGVAGRKLLAPYCLDKITSESLEF
jgi:hypothetical protein